MIERCLQKEPAKRFVDASALLEAMRVCRAALGSSAASQSEAMQTLIRLQQAPEVGQAVVPSSTPAASLLAGSSPPVAAPAISAPSSSVAKWVAIGVLTLIGLGAVALFFTHEKTPAPVPAVAPAAAVELGIACGHEKVEWMKWAAEQFKNSAAGSRIAINVLPMGPHDAQDAIMASDRRIQIFSPASSFYREAFAAEFKRQFSTDPIAREDNLALTPLDFISMFEEKYQAYIQKYKELNVMTLNDAMRTKGWEEIANKPGWGRFTFACSNPTEYNNGLTALTLMACYFHKKDQGP